ncbi:Arc family DNA-binding protein [Pseudomonas rhodesiae]|jgi:hypothetical protein|uniref:Arc family DNA-binding protein n=1 Tax=Pseudomonas rhodesiae TaxID=76760 RepID=UPI0028B21486|nr:Arc family DNA-binding protein [Pseudomonas rhodesiae]
MQKLLARKHEEKFVVRLPAGMRDQIALQASENARSMNSEIVHRLKLTCKLEADLDRALRTIDQLLTVPAAERPGAET